MNSEIEIHKNQIVLKNANIIKLDDKRLKILRKESNFKTFDSTKKIMILI